MPSKLVEREIENIKEEGTRLHTFSLADLVMMQVAGDDFNGFLDKVAADKDPRDIEQMIESTRENVTTRKIFPSIVQKTITAQFGEKHAALRELGQNGIDAYDPGDLSRKVYFTVSEDADNLILKARDNGCGMNLKELMRDLLVPYNSGKEFDPNKIGEHGIGWYSIVDLAELVKVTTRKKDSVKASQALVYREGDDWKATVNPASNDGFSKELHFEDNGTEVLAFIPKRLTNRDNIRNFLFQYLGLVPLKDAVIYLDKEVINSVSSEYRTAVPVAVEVDSEPARPLSMGVSKIFTEKGNLDSRFNHRTRHLDKFVYTQRGLFIKYDSPPFSEGTVHQHLAFDLMSNMGLDFWVDVPDNITLTKGRNNIIADHEPAVMDAVYVGFEKLFLDVLLNDEALLYHPSNTLLKSIATVFDKNYRKRAFEIEKEKYSFGRRFASASTNVATKVIDLESLLSDGVKTLAKKSFKGIMGGIAAGTVALIKSPFSIPRGARNFAKEIRELAKDEQIKNKLKDAGEFLAFKFIPIAGAISGAGYGIYKIHEKWGNKGLIYLGYGVGGAAGLVVAAEAGKRVYKAMPNISSSVRNGFDSFFEYLARKGERKSDVKTNEEKSPEARKIKRKNMNLGLYTKVFVKGMYGIARDTITSLPGQTRRAALATGNFAYHVPGTLRRWNLEGGELIVQAGKGIVHSMGLYTNLDEKRQKKREKMIGRISKKYMSRLSRDKFLQSIMRKEIIPAEYYYSTKTEEKEEKSATKSSTIGEMVRKTERFFSLNWVLNDNGGDVKRVAPTYEYNYGYGYNGKYSGYFGNTESPVKGLDTKKIKISIEQIIEAFLSGKLKDSQKPSSIKHGDLVVNFENPLVHVVVGKLDGIRSSVGVTYDPAILEDRIDGLVKYGKMTARGALRTAYFASFLWMPYLAAKGCMIAGKEAVNLFRDREKIQKKSKERVVHCNEKLSDLLRAGITDVKSFGSWAGDVGLSGAKFFLVNMPYYVGRTTVKIAKSDFTKSLNPIYYPKYGVAATLAIGGLAAASGVAIGSKIGHAAVSTYNFAVWEVRDYKVIRAERKIERERQNAIRADRRERLKITQEEEKEENEKIGFETRLKQRLSDFYYSSIIYEMFGNGIRLRKNFSKVGKNEIETIADISTFGRGYVDFMNAVEGVDKIVSEALNQTRYRFVLGFKDPLSFVNDGFKLDNKGVVQIDIGGDSRRGNTTVQPDLSVPGFNKLIFTFEDRERGRKYWSQNPQYGATPLFNEFDYTLLDILIHARAHDMSGKEHESDVYVNHDREFWEKKRRITMRVVEYIAKKEINLRDHVNAQISEKSDPMDVFYTVDGQRMSELYKMTRRRLREEKTLRVAAMKEPVKATSTSSSYKEGVNKGVNYQATSNSSSQGSTKI